MIRFFNGRVLTVSGGMQVTNQEVWVDGSTITYVLPHAIGDCRLHKMPVSDLPALIEQAIKA